MKVQTLEDLRGAVEERRRDNHTMWAVLYRGTLYWANITTGDAFSCPAGQEFGQFPTLISQKYGHNPANMSGLDELVLFRHGISPLKKDLPNQEANSARELEDQYHRWVRGELDAHDRAVEMCKKRIMKEYEEHPDRFQASPDKFHKPQFAPEEPLRVDYRDP